MTHSPASRQPRRFTRSAAELNAEQLAAVDSRDGFVLVLSGAGTGKTTVLVERILRMLREGIAPASILGVTFTRKAADEMRGRLSSAVDPGTAREVALDTFHAASGRLLRKRPEIASLTSSFEVADSNVSLRLVRGLLEADRAIVEELVASRLPDDPKLGQKVSGVIQRFKDSLIDPSRPEIAALAEDVEADVVRRIGAALYARYQGELARLNLADFGDLIMWPALAMEKDAALKRSWGTRWRYLKVDEVQDSNPAQQSLMVSLSSGHRNLCCVGDDDQTIHEWRGASPEFMLGFAERFPGAKVIRLERNYRSSGTIVRAGAALIAHNVVRLAKTLRTEAADGERIGTVEFVSAAAEARWIASELKRLPAGRKAFVLYRSNRQSRVLEEALIAASVPHRVHGAQGFYGRSEIKDALALAILVDGSPGLAASARREAFLRAANLPPRGLGKESLAAIEAAADADDLLAAAAQLASAGRLRGGAKRGLAALLDLAQAWQADAGVPLGIRLGRLLERSGYLSWMESIEDDAADRRDNLAELSAVASECGTIEALAGRAERGTVMSSADADVGLMTMHRSKGLEADWVFLPSWSPGVFPPKQTLELMGTGAFAAAIEGERRLAHVGLTRARSRCWVTWLSSGGPCSFVADIPEELRLEHRPGLRARSISRSGSPGRTPGVRAASAQGAEER